MRLRWAVMCGSSGMGLLCADPAPPDAVTASSIEDDGRIRACERIDDLLDWRSASFETAAEPVLGPREARTRGQLPQSL